MKAKIQDVFLPMSDGIRLYTRVVLPGEGRYPTVFMRTPYEKETTVTEEIVKRYEKSDLIRRGYAVVLQHCRGRNGSEGVCVPYADAERLDGLQTLEWIRTLPHYNGEVFFRGGSYTASVLLMLLGDPIPDLRGFALSVQTESLYHRHYFNGLSRAFGYFAWYLSMMNAHRPRIAPNEAVYVRPYKDMMRRATGEDFPVFTEQLVHDRYDGFWKNFPGNGVVETLNVPVLLSGGWFDYYCFGMCRMWEKLPAETRAKSFFLMSPFGHGLNRREDSDYPLTSGTLPEDREGAFFDHIRFGTPFPYAAPGEFRYYSIGEDAWHGAKSPYEREPDAAFFFSEEGLLCHAKPDEGSRSWHYDPNRPKHHDKHDYMYALDEETRGEDVLSFFSAPFESDASFFGPVRFQAEVSSDCDDTAFVFRLYLVEGGKSYNLVDAGTSVLHADPAFRKGGRTVLSILSEPTAFHVKKGCGIRVDVSSWSDCFVPHANTAEPFALAKKARIARNTLFFGESAVWLPADL